MPGIALEQLLNGIQYGLLLFLMAAGLTLVMGIMNFVNMAHGVFYMIGAYIAVTTYRATHSYIATVFLAPLITGVIGIFCEVVLFRHFYKRPPLHQVLCTVATIVFFNELVRTIWGPIPLFMATPDFLTGTVSFLGFSYPNTRMLIIITGLLCAASLYWFIGHTKSGMYVRAGASNRIMISVMGVNIDRLFALVFGLGAALAGLAGLVAAPIVSVQAGMGDDVLILTLVVIVIGGIGSVRGALISAILVGTVDTACRILLPPALGSVGLYLLLAVVLTYRPNGLFAN